MHFRPEFRHAQRTVFQVDMCLHLQQAPYFRPSNAPGKAECSAKSLPSPTSSPSLSILLDQRENLLRTFFPISCLVIIVGCDEIMYYDDLVQPHLQDTLTRHFFTFSDMCVSPPSSIRSGVILVGKFTLGIRATLTLVKTPCWILFLCFCIPKLMDICAL